MIAIRLVSVAGEPPASQLEAQFDDAGGDIGRGADCALVLPDPERRISRKHLQVLGRGGRPFLRLISTNLIVELDGVPMAAGVECPLEDGARIRIGPFLLRADAPPAPNAEDSMALLRTMAGAPGGPGLFHDLLHAAPPQANGGAGGVQEVDLVIGDPTGSRPRVAARAAADDALVDALYVGLGLAPPPPEERTPAQFRLIGALLRASVQGTLDLLTARLIAKRELGASPTQIQTRQNNPLKFAPDADVALAMLLAAPRRGFVPALEAVGDAFDDLRAHEVALLAGMRAALSAVLDRFDPVALEARLAGDKGLWDQMMGGRKAKLWERYAEQHASIAREIEENFDAIFAAAFVEAYEAQRSQLARPGGA
jgi:predicted component of type VI protein secretion system